MRERIIGWGVIILIALGIYAYEHWTLSPEMMRGVCAGLRERGTNCSLDVAHRRVTLSYPRLDGDPVETDCDGLRWLRGWTVIMRGHETRRELFRCAM